MRLQLVRTQRKHSKLILHEHVCCVRLKQPLDTRHWHRKCRQTRGQALREDRLWVKLYTLMHHLYAVSPLVSAANWHRITVGILPKLGLWRHHAQFFLDEGLLVLSLFTGETFREGLR